MKYYRVLTEVVIEIEHFIKTEDGLTSNDFQESNFWDRDDYKEFSQWEASTEVTEVEEHTQESFLRYFKENHFAKDLWTDEAAERITVMDLTTNS